MKGIKSFFKKAKSSNVEYQRLPTDSFEENRDSLDLSRISGEQSGRPRPDLVKGEGTISHRLLQYEKRADKKNVLREKTLMERIVKRIKEEEIKPLYEELCNFKNKPDTIQEILAMDVGTYQGTITHLKNNIDKFFPHKVWQTVDKKAQEKIYNVVTVSADMLESLRDRLKDTNTLSNKGRLDNDSVNYARENIHLSYRSLFALYQEDTQSILETKRELEKFSDYKSHQIWLKDAHNQLIEQHTKWFNHVKNDFCSFNDSDKPNPNDPDFMNAVESMREYSIALLYLEEQAKQAANNTDHKRIESSLDDIIQEITQMSQNSINHEKSN